MIEYRNMTEKDVDQMAEIEKTVFSTPWSKQSFFEALARPEAHFIVACEGTEVLGYGGIYQAMDEGEITNVAVHPKHRRKGIAKAIILKIKEDMKAAGVTQIFLEVRITNEPAIALYESQEFKQIGIRKGFYEKPKEDAAIMLFQKIGVCSC